MNIESIEYVLVDTLVRRITVLTTGGVMDEAVGLEYIERNEGTEEEPIIIRERFNLETGQYDVIE